MLCPITKFYFNTVNPNCVYSGYRCCSRNYNPASMKISRSEVNLMNTLRMLWEQHVAWTRFTIISIIAGLPDESLVTQRLLRNPIDFEKALTPFYGERISARFRDLFTSHLVIAAELVKAAKAGNNEAAADAEKRWYANADEIAAFLSRINPYWSQDDWKAMLHEHLSLTKSEAVSILTGNYAEGIRLYDKIEELLEQYLENLLTIDTIKEQIELQSKEGKIYTVFFGTAIKGEGVTDLLDGIIDYLPGPIDLDDSELSALVYKISHHKTLGKTAHLKLFSGKIESRDEVYNVTKDKNEKITVIKKIVNQKQIDVKSATSGDLVMVSGLDCSTYDILGSKKYIPKLPSIASTLLTLRIYPKKEEDYIPLVEALNMLQEEDPLLNMEWVKEKNEIHIQIMGKIQLEILEATLKERFNVEVTFGAPSVIYKETPASSGYVEESYTMPKPCWAVVYFFIEPLPKGSGIVYESQVRTEKIKQKYQREIENNLERILQQGIYGWNVTDLKITLVDGEDHVLHSRSGDFATATAMALMKGFAKIGTTLLEPMINFRITIPEDICGRVLNDIIQMRGSFESPTIHNDSATIEGTLPVATSLEYPVTLGIISSGRSVMGTKFAGYEPCSIELGATRERIGVNPLDRSKFILYVRNAL